MVISGDGDYRLLVPSDLGAALKYARTTEGVSQVEAAEWEGVSQPYLSSLESGKFGSSLSHALRLLRLLGYDIVVRRRPRSD